MNVPVPADQYAHSATATGSADGGGGTWMSTAGWLSAYVLKVCAATHNTAWC